MSLLDNQVNQLVLDHDGLADLAGLLCQEVGDLLVCQDVLDDETVIANVKANEKIAAFLAKQEGQIRKTIVVKNKLVNLIVK